MLRSHRPGAWRKAQDRRNGCHPQTCFGGARKKAGVEQFGWQWEREHMMNMPQPIRKRCHRYNIPGHAHELTFSCYKRRPFLQTDRARRYLADSLLIAKTRLRFDLWAYVIMPEHVHLLICPLEAECSISRILQAGKQSVSRRALRFVRANHPGALKWFATGQKHTRYRFWQDGGGYDRNITSAATLAKVVGYIHANPVRRGLVAEATGWEWSSAGDWHESGTGAIPVDCDSFPSF